MMDVLNAALTVSYPVHRAVSRGEVGTNSYSRRQYPFGRWFHRVSALLLACVGVFIVVWAGESGAGSWSSRADIDTPSRNVRLRARPYQQQLIQPPPQRMVSPPAR